MAISNDRILLGTRKGVFDVRRRQGHWRVDAPQLPGQAIAYAVRDPRNGSIWASLDHGHWGCKLARSKDDGATYADVEPPKYPEDAGATAKYYWVIAPAPADRPGEVWIGTEPGGLFSTKDDGASWQLNDPLWKMCVEQKWQGGGRPGAGIHSIDFDPRDSNHAYLAISCAGVVETRDGGRSWAHRNAGMTSVFDPNSTMDFGHDPHCVVMAPSRPDVLWQANHCGVYRTTDGAASWKELTKKPLVDFGFPVGVHPTNPDVAWLVPMQSDMVRTPVNARLSVVRTDDGGETWTEHVEGLPSPAYDFPFRHGFAVGGDGDSLALGTTSGNLYTSDDGGRSWQCLSNSLPPIYSVRFA